MRFPNASTALAWVIVDKLVRSGIQMAVASPGSRSTALILAIESHPEIELTMNLDERSAGFRALGRSIASGRPSVVVTTSGSAVANLAPAVAEADRAGVPLVALTADRPVELVERRANQTMDHMATLAGLVRKSLDVGPARDGDSIHDWARSVADALMITQGDAGPPGPVHINVRFEEPTTPVTDDGRSVGEPVIYESEPHDVPAGAGRPVGLPIELPDLGPRMLVIAGQGDYDVAALLEATSQLGTPTLTTALSGGRGGPGLAAYHHVLAQEVPDSLRPSSVLVVGRISPTDRLVRLLNGDVPVVHVDPHGVFSDPAGTMTVGYRSDPIMLIEALDSAEPEFLKSWADVDRRASDTVGAHLQKEGRLSGPTVVAGLNRTRWPALFVGSSQPIRDVDAYLDHGGMVFSNRGVSGIDGFNSTAIGVADIVPGAIGLVGDLSFLHDANGYHTERTPPLATIIVDNDGGGLFDRLPQAEHAPDFERLFVTPHGRELTKLAEFFGIECLEVEDPQSLATALEGASTTHDPFWIRAMVDRAEDLGLRRQLDDLVSSVVDDRG